MEEGSVNFKALRAKFQEEAMLAQAKTSRPTVAEKPKHLPPGGHCSTVVSSINIAVENKTPAVPRIIFRDGLWASGGKRPISFQAQQQQTPPLFQLGHGDGTTKQPIRGRRMPLVLPVLPANECKAELPPKKEHKAELECLREVLPQTKIKKKGLLPFKSNKVSKFSAENGEDPTYADLTTRPASASGDLSSMERQRTQDGVSLHGKHSTAENSPSSPDKPLPSPPKESFEPDILIFPPVCLPHLACISARPFFKTSSSARKSALDKKFCKAKVELSSVKTAETFQPSAPPKKLLPDWGSQGSVKPPRPPLVDLSCYHLTTAHAVSSGLSQASVEEPETERPSICNSGLDAPEFPDFENSEMGAAEGETIDVASLELEVLDLVSFDFPAPVDFGISDFEDPPPNLSASMCSEVHDVNLSSLNLISLDPTGFPDPPNLSELPEPLFQSEEKLGAHPPHPQAEETDLDPAESHPVTEEVNLGGYAALNDGIQAHPSVYQQNSYYETCDNVYEDVENVTKIIVNHNSWKSKDGLKNPYADNYPVKEEARLNMWPRNPWGGLSGEHPLSANNHVHSKERQSPGLADYKEQKKRTKQRMEREKKEQKEREKKENEMRKKFKVTGEEEPMYHAKVTVASKVRKNDLPVRSGDTVSIIRTTNCPKGKWLARDAHHKYGYISVMNVELNIKEMLELGKKAQAAGRGGNLEGDTISIGSRSSSHPVLTSSFTDDSEEWACEDETVSPAIERSFHQQSLSVSQMCGHASTQHTLSDANLKELNTQTGHEALQKLASFFQHRKTEFGDVTDSEEPTPTKLPVCC
ncbi:hypothetical protein LDENG_00106160 [Lucifuga dentata]|nr:hypothetical protein LDENG_00106160 [Lucifuga dentata]